MISLSPEQKAKLGLELSMLRQEHSDLDAAIHALIDAKSADMMMIQRLKKKKLSIKDRIIELEKNLLPDIIA